MDQQMQQTKIVMYFKDCIETLESLNEMNEQDLSYEEEIEEYSKNCEAAILATARNFKIHTGVVWESLIETILS